MKDRPILFSGPMVQAILKGRKTQTRRGISFPACPCGCNQVAMYDGYDNETFDVLASRHDQPIGAERIKHRYGVPGDRLWVRETFLELDSDHWTSEGKYSYRASVGRESDEIRKDYGYKWKPSIFMRRHESRITLEVTGVRVENLQSITNNDAIAEGLAKITKDGTLFKYGIPDRDGFPGNDDHCWDWPDWELEPRDAYRKLWDRINGKKAPWLSNPYVWVVEFRRAQ